MVLMESNNENSGSKHDDKELGEDMFCDDEIVEEVNETYAGDFEIKDETTKDPNIEE